MTTKSINFSVGSSKLSGIDANTEVANHFKMNDFPLNITFENLGKQPLLIPEIWLELGRCNQATVQITHLDILHRTISSIVQIADLRESPALLKLSAEVYTNETLSVIPPDMPVTLVDNKPQPLKSKKELVKATSETNSFETKE